MFGLFPSTINKYLYSWKMTTTHKGLDIDKQLPNMALQRVNKDL